MARDDGDESEGPPSQVRKKPPAPLDRPREVILACAPMRSAVNLSRIVRAAGCSGVSRIIACGEARLDPQIARDGAELVKIEKHRTLPPVLRALRSEGWHLIGLEQTGSSRSLYTYSFPRRCVLVIGNEREGLDRECLGLCHDLVEIPVYGLPYAHNAATAAAIALYEYCRQYPRG